MFCGAVPFPQHWFTDEVASSCFSILLHGWGLLCNKGKIEELWRKFSYVSLWNKGLTSYKFYKIPTEWTIVVRFWRIFKMKSTLKIFLWYCKCHVILFLYFCYPCVLLVLQSKRGLMLGYGGDWSVFDSNRSCSESSALHGQQLPCTPSVYFYLSLDRWILH